MAKDNQEGGKSVSDIAAMLVTNAETAQEQPVEEQDNEPDQEVVDTIVEENFGEEDDQSPAGGDEDAEEASDDETGDEQEDEKSDDEEEADEPDYLDIRDDDLITVTVDGEEQEVSIGDLKKTHSLGGATEKRLQEATEARKEAVAFQTQGLEMFAAQEKVLSTALDSLDDNLFKGVIPPPPDDLRQRDPDQYLRHKEAYDQDQKRIQDAKTAIKEKQDELERQRQERLEVFAQHSAQIIRQEIPELADPKTSKQTYIAMAETAKAYGYSDQEINMALDPRMFMLVRDAMRYRSMIDKTKERDPKDLEGQKAKKVRRLRSGNTQAKNRARQTDNKRKAAVDRARKTGKPSDVAATLLVPKG